MQILYRSVLYTFLFFLALPMMQAQEPATAVYGIVRTVDGAPVAAASVRVAGTDLRAVTDENGVFALPALPNGSYDVFVRAEGFGPEQRMRVWWDAAQGKQLALELARVGVVQETVVVTGTKTPHLLVEAPVRTDLILPEVVTRQVKTNLSELLTATVSGIRIENNCQNCGFTAIRLNGLEGPYTQILEDGLPSFSGVTSVYGLDQIPTEFLESVEIVKGGNSALYGPNAVAGVVNLIRREPTLNTFRFDALSGVHRGRPEHQVGANAQVVNLPGGFGADFFVRGAERTHIDRDADGFTEIPRRELKAGGGTFYRRFFDGNAKLVFGGSTLTEFRRGGSQLDLRPEQTFVTEMLDSGRSAGFIRWNHSTSPNTFYSINSTLTYMNRSSYYGADFDPNAYGNTRNPLSATDAQIGHTRGKHTLMAGVQYWWEHVEDQILAYNRAFDQSFSNAGFFVQDEYRLARNITILGGLRADKSNVLNQWVLSPRGNIRVGLGQNWNVRFGVSTGFRAPTIFDEDLHIASVGGEGFIVNRSANLVEERSLSYTASLDYTVNVNGNPLQAGASFFHTRLNDVFVFEENEIPGQDFRELLRVNGDGAHVRGVQFDLNWRLMPRVGLRSGVTLQQARFDTPEPQFGSLRFFRTPNTYGFFGADVDLPGEVDLSTTLDYTGGMIVPHFAGFIPEDRLERVRDFVTLDVVLGKTWNVGASDKQQMRLFFRGRNLTDSFQQDIDQGPLRDATYFYGPIFMRTLSVGMTFRF